MRVLVMIDMQNDFITGSLGSKDAQEVLRRVVKDINKFADGKTPLFYTMDSHGTNYASSLEGKRLPVEHCRFESKGWELPTELEEAIKVFAPAGIVPVGKSNFGSYWLPNEIEWLCEDRDVDWLSDELEIYIFGLCTDICVMANAITLRTFFKNASITVLTSWCAGTTQENHELAIEAMKMLNIDAE